MRRWEEAGGPGWDHSVAGLKKKTHQKSVLQRRDKSWEGAALSSLSSFLCQILAALLECGWQQAPRPRGDRWRGGPGSWHVGCQPQPLPKPGLVGTEPLRVLPPILHLCLPTPSSHSHGKRKKPLFQGCGPWERMQGFPWEGRRRLTSPSWVKRFRESFFK